MSALINGHDEDVRVSVPGRSGTRPETRRVPARGSGRQPRGSRIGDVTSGRIVRGGLARIERGRIVSRWARTARGGMDCVALGSHYASRGWPALAPARPGIGLRCPKVGGVLVVAGGVGRDGVNRTHVVRAGVSSPRPCGSIVPVSVRSFTSASRVGAGNRSPPAPGTPIRSASTSLNPRDRRVTAEIVT